MDNDPFATKPKAQLSEHDFPDGVEGSQLPDTRG
jgi:hypothetical protein